ncbi:MAG: DUF624 domain-containing protein [Acidobacteriota bacterium]|nr:DUF624 domain-containing protein [Acidobacteriota bacterium]
MKSWYSDSRFFQALEMAVDLVVLNLAMVVAGLPVVTGGAALVAGLLVCLRMVGGDNVRPIRGFLAAFRRAFLPATLAWLAGLGLTGLLVWEWMIASQVVSTTLAVVARGVVLLAGLLLGLVAVWFWPLLARRVLQDEPIGLGELVALLQTALLAGLQHLPRSLAALLIVLVPPVFGLVSAEIGARLLLWFLVIGCGLAAYLVVLVLRVPLGIRAVPSEHE